MHLAQHHFQTQSRYFENLLQFSLSRLFFKPYGLAGCELDAEALRNGLVSLVHARGIMADGLAFDFPVADAAPEPLDIRDLFSPTERRHSVLLAVPPYRPSAPNVTWPQETAGDGLRYIADTRAVIDELTGRDEATIEVGRKSFRLLLDTEPHVDLTTLPIARIVRDGAGHFTYDLDHIPPCLQIGASSALLEMLHRLLEVLSAKRDSLTTERVQHGSTTVAPHEIAGFWLLHAVSSSFAPLNHFLKIKRVHPERLYCELAALAGALCTFHLESDPSDLPLYDHDRLDEVFGSLERHIRSHLDVIIPKNCISIPLERERPLLFTGVVTDKRCFGTAEWVLGVHSSSGEAQVVTGVPTLVKICSAQFISRVVKEARPALELEHIPMPPAAISPRIGNHYFRINKTGPCWETIRRRENIGIYVPDALSDIELELKVVLEA